MKRAMAALGMVCLGAAMVGCEGPYNVVVKLDDKDVGLKDNIGTARAVEINIIAVNDVELPQWEQVSMNEYWEPDNALRKSAKKIVMKFGQDHPARQVLTRQDKAWKDWPDDYKRAHLLILASLPWIHKDQPGGADPRRIILPLNPWMYDWSLWPGEEGKTIPILIQSGGLRCLRQPKK